MFFILELVVVIVGASDHKTKAFCTPSGTIISQSDEKYLNSKESFQVSMKRKLISYYRFTMLANKI